MTNTFNIHNPIYQEGVRDQKRGITASQYIKKMTAKELRRLREGDSPDSIRHDANIYANGYVEAAPWYLIFKLMIILPFIGLAVSFQSSKPEDEYI